MQSLFSCLALGPHLQQLAPKERALACPGARLSLRHKARVSHKVAHILPFIEGFLRNVQSSVDLDPSDSFSLKAAA